MTDICVVRPRRTELSSVWNDRMLHLRLCVSESDDDTKAADCPFGKLKFHSMRDVMKIVKERRMHITELDIKPRPYGTCCGNRFDPVSPLNFCILRQILTKLWSTYFPHNALFPKCITCTYVCIFPTTTNQDARIFPTMHFPHNVSFKRIGVCVCLSVCVCVRHTFCQLTYTGQTPQRIFTVDTLKDADLRKDVPFGGSRWWINTFMGPKSRPE